MDRRTIVRCRDGDNSEIEYLDVIHETDIYDTDHNATIRELADLCDQDAESCNNHFAVGMHRILAVLLCKKVGSDYATKIMLEITELGGMDGLVGYGGKQAAYKNVGVNPPWDMWG